MSAQFVPFFCAAEQALPHLILGAMRLCLFECMRVCVLPGEAGQFEESQAKKRHLSIIRGGGGLGGGPNYETISVCANWWLVPLFHFDRFERTH